MLVDQQAFLLSSALPAFAGLFTMFCKATLTSMALALLATANPITQTPGVRIPLRERSTLTRADGTFDYDRANLDYINTYKCALIAY